MNTLKLVMKKAHRIAKQAAIRFGGKPSEYMALALKQAWKEIKTYKTVTEFSVTSFFGFSFLAVFMAVMVLILAAISYGVLQSLFVPVGLCVVAVVSFFLILSPSLYTEKVNKINPRFNFALTW